MDFEEWGKMFDTSVDNFLKAASQYAKSVEMLDKVELPKNIDHDEFEATMQVKALTLVKKIEKLFN